MQAIFLVGLVPASRLPSGIGGSRGCNRVVRGSAWRPPRPRSRGWSAAGAAAARSARSCLSIRSLSAVRACGDSSRDRTPSRSARLRVTWDESPAKMSSADAPSARPSRMRRPFLPKMSESTPPTGFPILAGARRVSHAFVLVLEFDIPVSIFGMDVRPGELIHADRHGAPVVPETLLDKLPEAIRSLIERERIVLEPVRNSEQYDFETFRRSWEAFTATRE